MRIEHKTSNKAIPGVDPHDPRCDNSLVEFVFGLVEAHHLIGGVLMETTPGLDLRLQVSHLTREADLFHLTVERAISQMSGTGTIGRIHTGGNKTLPNYVRPAAACENRTHDPLFTRQVPCP